mmetsp:Transcript_21012/g.53196  ORF Transcript_21012/g.53196 Transcript_21012/m.53196 type:complete len:239 (+) Transcript_21012:390-1106(+)
MSAPLSGSTNGLEAYGTVARPCKAVSQVAASSEGSSARHALPSDRWAARRRWRHISARSASVLNCTAPSRRAPAAGSISPPLGADPSMLEWCAPKLWPRLWAKDIHMASSSPWHTEKDAGVQRPPVHDSATGPSSSYEQPVMRWNVAAPVCSWRHRRNALACCWMPLKASQRPHAGPACAGPSNTDTRPSATTSPSWRRNMRDASATTDCTIIIRKARLPPPNRATNALSTARPTGMA